MDPLKQVLLEELERGLDEDLDRMASAIGATDDYAPIRDAQLRVELRQHGRHYVMTFLRSEREERPLKPDEYDFVRDRATQRAREMVSLAATVHGHLVGQQSTVEAIVGVAEKDARLQAEALRLVGHLADYTAETVTVLVEAYTETVEGEHAGREIDRRELLEQLISRDGDEDHQLVRRAPRLGLHAGGNQAVVIARLVNSVPDDADPLCKHLVAEGIARASGRGASHTFVVVRPDDVVAVLDRSGDCAAHSVLERVRRVANDRHGVDVVAGVGTVFRELSGLRASYDEACRALRHSSPARPIISRTEDIALFDDLAISSSEAVTRLIPAPTRQALQDPVLRSTLHAYVDADLNVAAAAKALILHPNSVRYRLRRIADLTGLDPRRITDLFELSAAARVLDADNHQMKALGD